MIITFRYLTHYIFFGLFPYSYTLPVTVLTLWVARSKCFTISLGFNGAEANCGISHILDILVMNSLRLIDISSNINFPSVLLNCVEREIINEILSGLKTQGEAESFNTWLYTTEWMNWMSHNQHNFYFNSYQFAISSKLSIPLCWFAFRLCGTLLTGGSRGRGWNPFMRLKFLHRKDLTPLMSW